MQRLQDLQFHSLQDCGREYSRISASSENPLKGQSIRLNIKLMSSLRITRIAIRFGVVRLLALDSAFQLLCNPWMIQYMYTYVLHYV